jgi:hypothetical protein
MDVEGAGGMKRFIRVPKMLGTGFKVMEGNAY